MSKTDKKEDNRAHIQKVTEMFSSGSNKSKRRSFFFFGSSEPEPSTTSTKSVKTSILVKPKKSVTTKVEEKPKKSHHHHSRSNVKSKKIGGPLDKKPLNNSNPSLEPTVRDDSLPSNVHCQSPEMFTPKSSSVQSLPKENKEPFITGIPLSATESNQRKPSRPPPPSIDPVVLQRSITGTRSNTTTPEINESPSIVEDAHMTSSVSSKTIEEVPVSSPIHQQSTQDISPNNSVKQDDRELTSQFQEPQIANFESKEFVPLISENPQMIQQHRRHRSEAEKLVDDIDVYLKEHKKSNSISVIPPFAKNDNFELDEKVKNLKLDTNIEMIETDISLESPLIYVSPLDVARNNGNNLPSNFDENEREPLYSNFEGTNSEFSFTGSFNNNSISDMQQNESNNMVSTFQITPDHSKETMCHSSDDTHSYKSNSTESVSIHHDDGQPNKNSQYDVHSENLHNSQNSNSGIQDYYNGHGTETNRHFSPDIYSGKFNSDFEVDEPKKTLRVVNEINPNFYLDEGDNSSSDDASNDTPITNANFSHHNQDNPYKGDVSSTRDIDDLRAGYINTPLDRNRPSLSGNGSYISEDITLSDLQKKSHPPAGLEERGTPSSPSALSAKGSTTTSTSTNSSKPDKNVRLVSSYVEELRLKYLTTSNFLQAPPNLPISLKQKSNLILPKTMKVRIKTNSKQVGIKHGKAKQKLLALETTNEETDESDDTKFMGIKSKINVDHTREFHNLFQKKGTNGIHGEENDKESVKLEEDYLKDIPGDDAYDSDDMMAPLRLDNKNLDEGTVTRSGTTVSYYTKNKERLRSGTLDHGYDYLQKLPTDINIEDYEDTTNNKVTDTGSISSKESGYYESKYQLHVANPDSD